MLAPALSGGMCAAVAPTIVVMPFHVWPAAWHVPQAAFTVVCPVEESCGAVAVISKCTPLAVNRSLTVWQPLLLQSVALPSGKCVVLAPPATPTAPLICQGCP